MFLIFDTETTGLPRNFNAPISDLNNWPRVVQLAWQLHDEYGKVIEHKDFLIRPKGFNIPIEAEGIHGISTELASLGGDELEDVLFLFSNAIKKAKIIIGHNVKFDVNVLGCEFCRIGEESPLTLPILDTCTEKTAELCRLPGGKYGKFKLPSLGELHLFLFNVSFSDAHNATADVEATTRCFLELIRLGKFSLEELLQSANFYSKYQEINPSQIVAIGLKHINLKEESAKLRSIDDPNKKKEQNKDLSDLLKDAPFAHLHNHSKFTILQSTSDVKQLFDQAAAFDMPAVALTDNGNMMAAFHFEKAASKYNASILEEREKATKEGLPFDKKEVLPIIGCEFNVCADMNNKTQKDNGYQVVFLAKNKTGYQNLIKLASFAYTKGMYYVPRIDKNLIEEFKNDIIVLSGNLNGEIPSLILNVGETQAEESLLWWKSTFKEDFYIEISRHNLEVENRVNQTLVALAKKHNVKLVATNNTFYLNKHDAQAHDVLLCVRDNELVETPKGRGRGFRYGLENDQYYFKSSEEMKVLFNDLPEAILTVNEIISKCEKYPLAREVLLPAFDIPAEFISKEDLDDGGKRGENSYLRHLTLKGAEKRYGDISKSLQERIDFELLTIKNTNYPGYFLIVQDFCQAARDMGVSVGPGRGSAAGSVVAYCTGITNIDPIKYDLLFERFLNPDRVSMPDIDIDFDDEGRSLVIDYVIKKYGANQVAQIITFGTMAAKSAIRDAARVMNLPLPEADRLSKLVPDLSLKNILTWDEVAVIDYLKNQETILNAKELRRVAKSASLAGQVLQKAMEIEGSLRNTGIHACGIIITPDDLTNFVPVALAKDSEMVCTQYDNSVAEDAGLLKMDFLGLKTLTLIKDAVKLVKSTQGIDLDPDTFSIDDSKTYSLFQNGETIGIFQYESTGMQKHLKELKPTVFADLIAMNALYRPGPMEYIPSYCKRKHGEQAIIYDLDDCEEYLKETYGITVYQEQVMLLSQKIADFSKGEADTLRKAMGKKDKKVLAKMKPIFIERASAKEHKIEILEKIWKDWEAFAQYAFNKSHSTCYAWIAYQTAFLKANYPAEYMSSVLSNNMNDIKQITFFMEECRRMGLQVLGPDVNESSYTFSVNKQGAIRFGLGAIKGLGASAIEAIIEAREAGFYHSIFDMTKRINLRICTKRSFESLAYAGALDSFKDVHRAQYFYVDGNNKSFLDAAMKYGTNFKESESSSQNTMFGEGSGASMPEPIIPKCTEWSNIYQLNKEKEVVGIFISGHPLDDFKLEIEAFCNGDISMLNDLQSYKGRDLMFPSIVTFSEHRFTKNGDGFGTLIIEDYQDSFRLNLFKENYLRFKHFMVPGAFLIIKGRIEIPRFRTQLEFVPHNIELLQDLREKNTKAVQLKISSSDLNEELIQKLNQLFTDNQGSCPIKFNVFDTIEGLEINLPSRSIRIKPSNELFEDLAKLDVGYKLN